MNVNKLTRDYLQKQGFKVDKAESHNVHSGRTKDLFGFVDFVALGPGRIIGVQATTRSNRAARVRKITEECREDALAWLAAGGQIVVLGWKDGDAGEVWLTSDDFRER